MNKEKTILGEIERRTKKNERHYRKNDGTTECVISNGNINYFDEKEQKWKHTDNSLVEKENCYEGNLGNFQAKISKENKGIDVLGKDVSVAWEYLGMEKPKKKGKNPTNTKKPNMKVKTRKADNEDIIVGSDALYEEADDGVDIQYIMQGNNVKENIIVKEKQKEYKFKFAFKLNGLKMKASEDHTKIELYSEKTDKLEFTIPSPYMYDANNATSTDVCYEIEETENEGCVFYVVASETWINDAERQFPVIIDPQLVTSNDEIIKYNIVQSVKSSSGTNTVTTNINVSNYLKVYKSSTETLTSEIIISRDEMDLCANNIADATLYITPLETTVANKLSISVYADGTLVSKGKIPGGCDSILLPLSTALKTAKTEIRVIVEYLDSVTFGEEVKFYATGENAPAIKINYVDNINRIPTKKSMCLVGGVDAHVDLLTGETVKTFTDVVDDVMGIEISHVLKNGNHDFCCGDSVRLNLHEKLERQETDSPIIDYIYTDEMGEKHLFNEHFYYLDKNGVKHTVEKPYVNVEPSGIMYYMSDEGVRRAYREVYTHNGLKAVTTLENMNGLHTIEQRIDEQKQLEEQIENYKNALTDFVVVDENGEICETISPSELSWKTHRFAYSTGNMMSKNEALSLSSLMLQKEREAIEQESNDEKKLILESQLETLNNQKNDVIKQMNTLKEVQLDATRRAEMSNAFYGRRNACAYYAHVLDDYVVINENGEIISGASLASDDSEDGKYALTTGEALQYRSLYLQKNNLEITIEDQEDENTKEKDEIYNYSLIENEKQQVNAIQDQMNSLKELDYRRRKEYEKIEAESENYNITYINQIVNYVLVNGNGEIVDQISITSYSPYLTVSETTIKRITDKYNDENGNSLYVLTKGEAAQLRSLFLQLQSLEENIDSVELQLSIDTPYNDSVTQQIEELFSKDDEYRTQFRSYAKEYHSLVEELKKLKLQIPVNYLTSDNVTKGFNENGDLVVVYKNNGGYIAIEYNYYDLGTYTRISRVYDENEREIKFFYDDRQLLTEIVDAVGNKVTFDYDILKTVYVGILKKVTFADGHSVSFERIDNVETVSSDDKYAEITRNFEYKTQSIALFTNIKSVGHNVVERFETPEKLSEVSLEYDLLTTTITDNYGDKLVYIFDSETENICEYYEIIGNKVTKAEKYEYVAFGHMNVESANESVLEKYAYDNFVFPVETVDVETIQNVETAVNNHKLKLLDEYNKVVKEIDIQVDGSKRLVTTNYTYDESDRVVKVEVKTVDETETTSVVQTMEYDSASRLVRKQSYEVGKEAENGIDIEEYVYNEKGYEIKSIKYNTLDTSSKLYTEKETNDIGQVISELDVLGKCKSTYEYLAGTNTVCSKLSPNGSKLSYGFSPENGQDSITMSTEDGEENSTQRFYTNGLLTQVISGDNVYEYTYDHKGRETSVSINGQLHISYSYEDRITENGKTVNKVTATYANGDNVTVTEDLDGNVLSVNKRPYDYDALVVENRTKLLDPNASQIELNITNEYDDKHRVIKKMDSSVNDCVFSEYEYDEQDRVTSYSREATFGSSLPFEEEYSYNSHGNVTERTVRFNNGRTDTTTCEYDEQTQKLKAFTCAGSTRIEPKVDCLGRNRGKTVSWLGTKVYSEDITYLKHGDHATNMPLTISYGNNTENGFIVKDRIKYKYDEMGNICEAYENGQFVTEYKYDALGRLVRENNKKLGKTFVFSYDNKGNILTRTEYAFTLKDDDFIKEATGEVFEYVYSGEKLVSYNGESFEYDDIGNPTTYRGNTLTWRFGRRLTSFGSNTFDYSAEGKRIKKNDISYIYDSQGRLFSQSNGIEFFYDESSLPIAFAYNGEVYYYKKDLLGNVIEILDTTGTAVVRYTYDAWGNHTVIDYTDFDLGSVNPIKYRSYYYDTETGLYFLQTRYYDPQIGRFINIDDISYLDPKTINGLNLYSYCGNNPITRIDACGCDWWNPFTWDWSGIFKSIGNAFSAAGQWVNNNVLKPIGTFFENNWDIILGVGLVIGAIVISVVTFGAGTVIAGVIAGAVFGAAFGAINALASGGNVLQGAFTGMFVGALGGVSSWAAFAGAAGMSLINDRINGEKAGMGSLFKAALAGLTAGLFARSCNGMFNAVKNELASKTIESIASVLFSFVFSAQNFATDIIINALMSK